MRYNMRHIRTSLTQKASSNMDDMEAQDLESNGGCSPVVGSTIAAGVLIAGGIVTIIVTTIIIAAMNLPA